MRLIKSATSYARGTLLSVAIALSPNARADLNDNDARACERALRTMGRIAVTTLGSSHLVYRSREKEARLALAQAGRASGAGLDVMRSMFAVKRLGSELPVIEATDEGCLVIEEIHSGLDVKVTRWDASGAVVTSSIFSRSRVLASINGVSADAAYLATDDEVFEHVRVVSTRSGDIVHEERCSRAGEHVPLRIHFAPDAKFFTLRRGKMVFTREITGDGTRVHAGTEVGAPMRELGTQGEFTVSMDALGDLAYLPRRNGLAAAYHGPVPLFLDLSRGPRFRRLFFEPATRDWGKADFDGMATIDAGERVMAASRTMGFEPKARYSVEIFDLIARRHVRGIAVPSPVTALAVREHMLAVGFGDGSGVRIYDLTRPQPHPTHLIETRLERIDTLKLTSASTVALGSRRHASLYRVTFR